VKERVHTTLWMTRAVHEELKTIAREEERSVTWWAERAIKDALIRKGRLLAPAKAQGEAAA
jgi:hypothetical protein